MAEPSEPGDLGDLEAVFAEQRGMLFAVAYRMLGSVADAEDVVQDAWLRWSAADRSGIADPKGYLVRIATNLAVDRLRSARTRRENYVGPWLPEPLLTSPDAAERVELAESVSMAMLVVLETLSPLERAVFVLREVFGFRYGEIAAALDRTEASVRQLGTRARKHVEARRPRFETDRDKRREVTDRFLKATLGGDLNELMAVLAPDVTLWTDGGGKVKAARRAVRGADKVGRFLAMTTRRPYRGIHPEQSSAALVDINGVPGIVISGPEEPIATIIVDPGPDGRVAAVHMVANPDKLRALRRRR